MKQIPDDWIEVLIYLFIFLLIVIVLISMIFIQEVIFYDKFLIAYNQLLQQMFRS